MSWSGGWPRRLMLRAGERYVLDCSTCDSLVRRHDMLIQACKAKIHRATVTEADLDYVGSITYSVKHSLKRAGSCHSSISTSPMKERILLENIRDGWQKGRGGDLS